MFNNIGTVDRLIRLILAIAIGLAYFGLVVYSGSTLEIVLTIGATVSAVTALASSCLLYGLLGINTRKQNPQQN